MQLLDRLLTVDVSWLWFSTDVGLKATLLLAIAAAMTVVLRAGSAAVRHRVWAITFAALLLLPLANGILPGWNWRLIPPGWRRGTESAPPADSRPSHGDPAAIGADHDFGARNPTVAAANQLSNLESSPVPLGPPPERVSTVSHAAVASGRIAAQPPGANSPSLAQRLTWLLLIWLAGVLAALLPLATGIIGNLLLKRRGRRLVDADWHELLDELSQRLGLRRKVTLLVGGTDQMPMTFGWLHPYVVLPADAANWPRDQRQAVLLHELAHVKRCDVPLQMIARAAFALYWFHPLAWWGIRRMRLEREHACDDCVLLAGQKASSYAAQLLEIARAHRRTSPLATAALSMARPSQLEGRLLAVLDSKRSRAPLSAARTAALALLALLIVISLGVLRPSIQAESPLLATGKAEAVSKKSSAPSAESGDPLTITGTVVTPKGKPAAGALVEIVAMDYSSLFRQTDEKDDTIQYQSASTDAAGRFAIVLPRETPNRQQIMAFASAEGFTATPLRLTLKPHQKIAEVKLELAESKTVHLQLIDVAGNPVSGIEPDVWFLDRAKSNGVYLGDNRAAQLLKSWPKCTRTGDDGFCRLVIPAATVDVVLVVESEKFGWQKVQFETTRDQIAVVLKPGRYLSGRVVDSDTGAPIEGAEVTIPENSPVKGVRTDKDGRFRIAGGVTAMQLAPGETFIKVFPPASSPYLFHWHVWKWPNDITTDAQLTIKMEKGILVEGEVVDKAAGKPIIGASVYYFPQEYNNDFFRAGENSQYQWPFETIYKTDDNGHFRLPVSPGPGYVLVKAPTRDFVRVMVSDGETYFGKAGLKRGYYDGALHLDLKPGEKPAPYTINLHRGVTLRRKVVQPDGQPAEGHVYYRSDEFDTPFSGVSGMAWLEDGVLELPGFEPEHSNPLFIADLGHHCAATASPGASGVDLAPIQLQRTGSAKLHFVNDRGEALANYEPILLLIVTPGAPATFIYEAGQPLWADSVEWRNIAKLSRDESPKTDAKGSIIIDDLIPGATYRVRSHGKRGLREINEFTVRPGETTNVGDVIVPLQD